MFKRLSFLLFAFFIMSASLKAQSISNINSLKFTSTSAYSQALENYATAGFKDIDVSGSISFPGNANHEMGTARMGHDPKTSVLNKWNQMHEVPNVFITDGSCMSSSACQNPSLTYMALTARACYYAVKEMKKQNL